MPLKLYQCNKCNKEFEVLCNFDDKIEKCIYCDSKNIESKIGRTTFTLKGGGWASDGYSSTKI